MAQNIDLTDVRFVTGTGDPNTVVNAPKGSIYIRLDGGASTRMYINNNGITGWAAVTSA